MSKKLCVNNPNTLALIDNYRKKIQREGDPEVRRDAHAFISSLMGTFKTIEDDLAALNERLAQNPDLDDSEWTFKKDTRNNLWLTKSNGSMAQGYSGGLPFFTTAIAPDGHISVEAYADIPGRFHHDDWFAYEYQFQKAVEQLTIRTKPMVVKFYINHRNYDRSAFVLSAAFAADGSLTTDNASVNRYLANVISQQSKSN